MRVEKYTMLSCIIVVIYQISTNKKKHTLPKMNMSVASSAAPKLCPGGRTSDLTLQIYGVYLDVTNIFDVFLCSYLVVCPLCVYTAQ